MNGPRVGTPAAFRLVATYLVAALVCWLLAAAALLHAAPDLARGRIDTPETLLAVHLLALGFLPLAVSGAALHILPTLLRNSGDPRRGWTGLLGLCAGPFLALGIARHQPELTWAAATLVGLGGLAVLAELAVLVVRAPRGRTLLASRVGVAAAGLNALLAFLLGPILFLRDSRPWLGIPHERLIAIHLHLAALARFGLVLVHAVRRNRLEAMEGPLAHFAAGLLFLVQAAVLAIVLLSRAPSLHALTAYVILLLLGWGAGVTLGHLGKLLSLSAWTWWPPGPRPKQGDLYDRRSWIASAAAFAAGTQLLTAATLAEATAPALAGAALLVVSALAALHGAAHTLAHARPATTLRPRHLHHAQQR